MPTDPRQMLVSDDLSDAFHNLCRVYGVDVIGFVGHFSGEGEWSDLPPALGSVKGATALKSTLSTLVILMEHTIKEMQEAPVS